jgi:energy-coupling factor transporter ATP-binding protein EcfA2
LSALDIIHDVPNLAQIPKKGDVFELFGPPASGKSVVLAHLISVVISPQSISLEGREMEVATFGHQSSIAVADCDLRFNISRIAQTLSCHIGNCVASALSIDAAAARTLPTVQREVTKALRRIRVFQTLDQWNLLAIVRHLVKQVDQGESGTCPKFLIIDSLSAVLLPFKSSCQSYHHEYDDFIQTLGKSLQKLRLREVTTLVSTWHINPTTKDGPAANTLMLSDPEIDFKWTEKLNYKAKEFLGISLGKMVDFRICFQAALTPAITEDSENQNLILIGSRYIAPSIPHVRYFEVHSEGLCDVPSPDD